MRHLTKGNSKTIDIRLNEEKFYFPGETIRGVVTVHPKSPTKTNHITLRFTGEVFLSIKDKETITLFQKTETIAVANDGAKTHVLDAKQHIYDFEFVVPDDLPSAMEFGKRKARIRYMLTAIHDRPMVPESLCARSEYTVPILEFVDVQSPQYNRIQEQNLDFVIPQLLKSSKHRQCQLKVSMPKFGFTRGDLVKLSIVFNHYESFTREKALKVDLIRKVDIRTSKNTFGKEDVLKSVEHDINIIGPYNFSQAINSQILIPTSTPPSIRYKDKVIDIHYKIVVRLYLEKRKSVESQSLEMPIVIGTWPKADVPIDDDDDDEYYEESHVMSDSDDDDDIIRRDSDFSLPPPPQPTQSKSSTTTYQTQHRRNVSSSMLSVGSASASTVTLTLRNTHISDTQQQQGNVVRSDSNASHSSRRSQGSERSWRSSQSYESRSPTLSRNTSASTNLTTPDGYYSSNSNSNGGRNMIVAAGTQTYINRSSSTPDLLNNPPIPPPAASPSGSVYPMRPTINTPPTTTSPTTNTTITTTINNNTNPNIRTSYYDATSNVEHQQQQQQQYPRITYQQQQQYQSGQNEYNSTPSNVRTHVLQPLSSSSSNNSYAYANNNRSPVNNTVSQTKPRMPHRNYDYSFYDDLTDSEPETNNNHNNQIPLSSDDSDDSDDDGDLLRIIEKKKKQEERARRARGRY